MTRCPYHALNGTHCPKPGTVAIKGSPTGRSIKVCAEHLPRYLNNGWRIVA